MKSIYIRLKNRIRQYRKQLFYFLYPNRINIYRKKIVYSSIPSFNQVTLCLGQGTVEFGSGCSFGFKMGGFNWKGSIELQARFENSKIKIGNNVWTNNNIFICAANNIEIGENTLIGQFVTIMDFEAHGIHPEKRKEIGEIGQVYIGRNVWIGNNSIILKNTIIGDNSIVASGAVVSGKFPANVILGGVPAKIIKSI